MQRLGRQPFRRSISRLSMPEAKSVPKSDRKQSNDPADSTDATCTGYNADTCRLAGNVDRSELNTAKRDQRADDHEHDHNNHRHQSANPLVGGGMQDIAFLVGKANPNANAIAMTATVWIETVQLDLQVPVMGQVIPRIDTYNYCARTPLTSIRGPGSQRDQLTENGPSVLSTDSVLTSGYVGLRHLDMAACVGGHTGAGKSDTGYCPLNTS